MQSPARRHYIRQVAAAAAAAAGDSSAAVHPDASVYELHLAQLAEHKRRLKALQSVARKIEVKRQLLPEYVPYVDGVLSAGKGAQDDVLMTVMVWRIDVGDLVGALAIAQYALAHKLTLPDQYKRDTATLVAEEVAEYVLQAVSDGTCTIDDTTAVAATLELTADHDMPDEVRAKMHKALGYALRDSHPDAALAQLQLALHLNDRAGVKKDIERLERELKNNPPPQKDAPPPGSKDVDAGKDGAADSQTQAGDTSAA